jgi:HD superfamily phosphohydrolase YqeK
MAREEGLNIDEILSANPLLLHADVSVIVALDTFAVKDTEVLNAIACHTLGRPDMSPLSCIVFLVDDKAVYLTRGRTLKKLLDSPRLTHPRLIATRNKFLDRWKYGGE